ncbi:MAG: ATP-binding cassette domain-containing protein [Candidatus Muiribacteriota bacterium]
MIEIKKNLIKTAQKDILYIDYFRLSPAKKYLINGASGSGKTLFLKYVAGILDFYDEFQLKNNFVFKNNKELVYDKYCGESRDFFYIGQDIENYLTGVFCEDELAGVIPDDDYENSLKHAVNFLEKNKSEFINKKISTLSQGGMQKLLVFAAILSGRKYIFLDEPFARLDFDERKKTAKLLSESCMNHNISFIIGGHGIETFHLEFDESFIIKNKKLIPLNNVESIKKNFLSFYNKKKSKEGSDKKAVEIKNVDFKINKKEIIRNFSTLFYYKNIYAIVGKNGSGKTTLAKLIHHKKKPGKGVIIKNFNNSVFLGRNPDYHFLFGKLTEEAEFSGVKINDEILRELNIPGLEKLDELSYGQKMRFLMYLYSNVQNSDVFIFDESLSGQDKEGTQILFDIFLKQKKKGKCIILIGQDKFCFRQIADKIIFME